MNTKAEDVKPGQDTDATAGGHGKHSTGPGLSAGAPGSGTGGAAPVSEGAAPREPGAITIEVDGRPLAAHKGQMLIEVTDANGITIPRFCYHEKLSVAANCRMCLVDIEKAPKPMPACATPVMDGMKVSTRSDLARDAQKGVLEFLLINHPLDCPVCDQGGECPLQDQAMGYGKDDSRFTEGKRVVPDVDIGPLIATYMTRCIHCTRCVRFGQEIAGVMEFGGIGRGEHTEIRTFLNRSVDSELSGNVIDLCPVGALTSKPFRFKARAWELDNHASIGPHDCVGSNLTVQSRRGQVMRVLPRVNEAINECWLSDRDRYSYEALNGDDRLTTPMIKRDGEWEEVDWQTALEFAVAGIKRTIQNHGAERFGALASPTATVEEFYLLQKLMRALGSGNVDHRLRQLDFSDDAAAPVFPWLGQTIAELEQLDVALLVGANPRKDQPLVGHRLRKAQRRGAKIVVVNPLDYDFTYQPTAKLIAPLGDMAVALAGVVQALAAHSKKKPPKEFVSRFGAAAHGAAERAIAETLLSEGSKSILLGCQATGHPQASNLRALAQLIADLGGARLGFLPEANAAGAWLAGCVPHRGVAGQEGLAGLDAFGMLREPLKAYLLLGLEPELDCLDGARARAAVEAAEFVVLLHSFKSSTAAEYADVLLPLAAFTERAGTFVNAEGQSQTFEAAVEPSGEARPGWKILRVLGTLLGAEGFNQADLSQVRGELDFTSVKPSSAYEPWGLTEVNMPRSFAENQVMRIVDVPIYAVDAVVRRAPALQATADNPKPAVRMNASQAGHFGFKEGESVLVRMLTGDAKLDLVIDPRVPDGCILIAAGYPETATLGAHGPATLMRAPS